MYLPVRWNIVLSDIVFKKPYCKNKRLSKKFKSRAILLKIKVQETIYKNELCVVLNCSKIIMTFSISYLYGDIAILKILKIAHVKFTGIALFTQQAEGEILILLTQCRARAIARLSCQDLQYHYTFLNGL